MTAWGGVTGFSPASGPPGTVVTITGSGLSGATLVSFNADSPINADFIVVSDSELQTVAPLGGTTGPLQVTVGTTVYTSTGNFYFPPTISGFSPPSAGSPSYETISGANFVANATTVTFTGAPAAAATVESSNQVTLLVPASAATGPITVTTAYGSAVSATSFIDTKAPSITDLNPYYGTNGESIEIDGANFVNGGTAVKFDNIASSKITVVSANQINATVPSGAATGPVEVTTANGSFTTTSNFVTSAGPLVTSFSPTAAERGASVNIYGLSLAKVSAVYFNGVSATITGEDATSVDAYVPSSATSGLIKVTSPQGSFTNSTIFTVVTSGAVSGFYPPLGPVGTPVTISGLDFTGLPAGSVKFDGVEAGFTVTSDTLIQTSVPTGAGTGPITVESSTTSSNFTVTTAAPVILGFTPAAGVRGETVTITGGNFTNLSSPAVTFNGAAATNTSPTSTTALEATLPAAATSGAITVSTSKGTAASPKLFYCQPWITNFTPASGFAFSNLTIVGRNFTNASAVMVGGVSYAFKATATQIVATIPAAATNGAITITAPGGVFISTNSFVVLPKIYSFTPFIGPPGTVVTITGSSFLGVTNVEFGGANAAPSSVTSSQLQAAVPAAGATGPITVVTATGQNATATNFLVTSQSLVVLTKTSSAKILETGSDVTFTLEVSNEGPSLITSVVVTDTLPTGLEYVSASSSIGTTTHSGQIVKWSLPILTNDRAAFITVVADSTETNFYNNVANLVFAEPPKEGSIGTAGASVAYINQGERTLAARAGTTNVVISWPASAANFELEVNTNLLNPNLWSPVSPGPKLINGTNYYTHLFQYPAQFFRLRSQ